MEQIKRARGALCAALSAAVLLTALTGCGKKEEPAASSGGRGPIQYASEGVTAVEDPDALQRAVDEMYEKAADPGVALEYKNGVFSEDGTNFTCYIANAAANTYDMFIAIYGDSELTDELFVSGLLRPGQAFSTLALEKPLESGEHRVYVAFTQVEEDLETIHAQVLVTMDFTVA